MKIAVLGGKLQGCEALYLLKEASYESILIDRNPDVIGRNLCDRFILGDIVKREPVVLDALREADCVVPATENYEMLQAIKEIAKEDNLKVAFDFDAYEISSSKIRSDKFFLENSIPAPRHYPDGKAPYIVKPSGESGSRGVKLLNSDKEVKEFFDNCDNPSEWLCEEYLEGPSYSLEVIGNGKEYRTYTVTQIHMDSVYDCCKVTAPVDIPKSKIKRFEEIGQMIGKALGIKGLTDIEVIDDGEDLKVLEIDARIPSQTPIAVYYSSGNNLLKELIDITLNGEFTSAKKEGKRHATYEHYRLEKGELIQEGEHSMTEAKPLHFEDGLFGSMHSVTDYAPGSIEFRGIFINHSDSPEELKKITDEIPHNIQKNINGSR